MPPTSTDFDSHTEGNIEMPHPNGGRGSPQTTTRTFAQVHRKVAAQTVKFLSRTGEPMTARATVTRDGRTALIALDSDQSGHTHGWVCAACWGFARSCSGSRIGHAVPQLACQC
jgi:hypothetical protein